MKTFWLLLVLVLLFIIGSASMLRYFDQRSMRQHKNQQDNNNH